MDSITAALSSLFSRQPTGAKRADTIRAKLDDLQRQEQVARETLTAAKGELAKQGAAAVLSGQRAKLDRTAIADSEAHLEELALAREALAAALAEAEAEERLAEIERLTQQGNQLHGVLIARQTVAWVSILAGVRELIRCGSPFPVASLPSWTHSLTNVRRESTAAVESIASALSSLGANVRKSLPASVGLDPTRANLPADTAARIEKDVVAAERRIAKAAGVDLAASQALAKESAEKAKAAREAAEQADAEARKAWVAGVLKEAKRLALEGIKSREEFVVANSILATVKRHGEEFFHGRLMKAINEYYDLARSQDGVDPVWSPNSALVAKAIGAPVALPL